ncbi:MAG: GntR family transcriptional regulator [Maritimibacter sp.]|uniref:GntR family transcriptional regulator n=1 Tax=Maritimibacter sp. TaxID=2003363 RepID=UPI001D9552D3|nr:GntR family transcriptional regulator [Maritimibacter sp.]MBL6425921.1 GntR family transcriptional regulator [Maritimibacter sp.]
MDLSSNAKLEDGILDHLQSRILAGHLPPGTKLGEETLAEIYGVPRSKIRQTLQRLSYIRLVDLIPNRGAFIARPTPKDAADIIAARRAIESVTTEIATRTMLTHKLKELEGIVRQEQKLGNHQIRAKIELAGDFHRTLSMSAHNAALTEALEPLILRTALVQATYPSLSTAFSFAKFHSALVEEIERGRSRRCGHLMERGLFELEASLDLSFQERREVRLDVMLNRVD